MPVSELRLDLYCLAGAFVGCNVVVIPFVAVMWIIDHLFISKPALDSELSFPTDEQLQWLFIFASLLPAAALTGLLLGWAWTVRRIRTLPVVCDTVMGRAPDSLNSIQT